MKLWHKILVAPSMAIVFLLILGASAYGVLTRQHSTLGDLFNNRFTNYKLAAQASQDIGEVHSGVYRLFTWIGNLKEGEIDRVRREEAGKIDQVSKRVAHFSTSVTANDQERKIAEAALKKLAKYGKDVDTAIDLSTVDINTGMSAMQTADSDFQDMMKEFRALVEIETGRAQAGYDDANATFAKVIVIFLGIAGLALAGSLGTALYLSRRIVRPLQGAIEVAGRIAGGDLTAEVTTEGRDETAELLHALGSMNRSLKGIVLRVRQGTDLVASASRELGQGNTDLSTRTEEQASALEETSASMQQMRATVGQNAQNAKKANELAAQASGVAAKGGEVVREAVGTMNGITEASKKIADIIGVIDGIAFQTNILALNAAVEAARAGEQGRGFAVVASEVRSLAQRSATAAKEIRDLIKDSVAKVDAGSRQVNDAGRTMEDIVSSVNKVTALIAEISAASQEQAQGIEQVSETMAQLERVTHQNAAMVEQASAAATSLEEQSEALSSAVATFHLGEMVHIEPAALLSVPRRS